MADTIFITASGKREKYSELLPQLYALLQGEPDLVACMANTAAALRQVMNFFWVGFYIVKNEELVLGPFQGPVACVRIKKGKGVCGTAWEQQRTILVPDVDKFPGHIACSSESKSEIVVPLFSSQGNVTAVFDVDSDKINDFDETDKEFLERICALLQEKQLN
jgi:L-methionine (R)-S-oxide reductase